MIKKEDSELLDKQLDLTAKLLAKKLDRMDKQRLQEERYKREKTPIVYKSAVQTRLEKQSRSTIRLNLTRKDLANSILLLENSGGSPANLAYSTVISQLLTAVLSTAIRSGRIPTLTESQAADFLRKRDAVVEELSIGIETIESLRQTEISQQCAQLEKIENALLETQEDDELNSLFNVVSLDKIQL